MEFGEKGNTEKVILRGRDKVKLNPTPPATAANTHLTLTEVLEELDTAQMDEVSDIEDVNEVSNTSAAGKDQETSVDLSKVIGSSTEEALGLGKSLLSREHLIEHSRKPRGSLKKDRVFTVVGTDEKGVNIMVSKVHKPYRSVIAFGCYAGYNKVWPSVRARTINIEEEQSMDLDTMRSQDIFDRESLEMNDIDIGMETLLDSMQDLKSHELADRLLIEDIAAEVYYMKRSFKALSNQPSEDSAQLEEKLRGFCVELLENVFSVTPRVLLLKNKRYLLAVAVKCLCAILSVYLHTSRGDCIEEDFTMADGLDSADMEEVSSMLIKLVVSGTDSDVPSESIPTKSVKQRSTKRGSSKKKKKKKKTTTEVEMLTAPQFTNAVYEGVQAIPEVGVRLQKPKGVINRILSAINGILYSNEDHQEDKSTAFSLRHRNALYGCVVYLIAVCRSEGTPSESLFGLMDSIKDAGRKLGYEKNVSILPPLADLLNTVSPHIIPGVLCLDLFCRFLDEELARREFIHRIARRDAGVSDLQFLNVTLPQAADAAINAAAARAREEAKLSPPTNFAGGGDLMQRLKVAREHWMKGLASYVEKQRVR